MAYRKYNLDFSGGAAFWSASVYLLFSANTMTGNSACSHPAKPVWERIKIESLSKH
jgi:hypothetical protein